MTPAESESPKCREARESLPEDLHEVFYQLVAEYKHQTIVRYGRGYVAYSVLADLVMLGWRPSATPRDGQSGTS